MELIAHRGACFDAPENSLEAFEKAALQGADRLELDVRLSADGVPMVCHDARTGRVGRPDLAIEASTASRLAAVRLSNGEPLPSLEAVCRAVDGRLPLDVELKTADPRVAAPVLGVLARHGMLESTLLSSFDEAVLTELRHLGFEGRTGLLVGSKSYSPRQRLYEVWPMLALRRASATDLIIHHRLAHAMLRRWLSRWRLGCLLWTAVEDEAVDVAERATLYRRLAASGANGVILGRVAEARPSVAGRTTPR